MGKLKNKLIEIEDVVAEVYMLGDFYNADSFREECRKELKARQLDVFRSACNEIIERVITES